MTDQNKHSFNLGEDTYWEKIARSRWGSYISEVEERAILLADQLSSKDSIALEIGCEGGRWTSLLIQHGWEMTCTEINPAALAVCQARNPSANCILVKPSDITLPCETASISLILCIEVFYSGMIWSDWFKEEAFRILSNDGLVVGVFNNKYSLRGGFCHLRSVVRRNSFDSYEVAYSTWKKRFCQQGFRMLFEEGICWFPFTRDSNSGLIPFFTGLENRLGLRRFPNISPWIVFLAQKMPYSGLSLNTSKLYR